jgi:phage shock protein PspC (stress-responsive transcriptional regulator)
VTIEDADRAGLRSLRIRACIVLLAAASLGWASDVHTNPLNRDPLVREAFVHFYNLDYPGAVERFERFHSRRIPAIRRPTALLLEAVVFQELYRQDLLDTTFYANDGFLTGTARHGARIPRPATASWGWRTRPVHEADLAALGRNPNDVDALYARAWVRSPEVHLPRHGGAELTAPASGWPPRPRTTTERVLQLDPDYVDAKLVAGVYAYVVGALPWPFKLLIGFAGNHRLEVRGAWRCSTDAGQRGVITSVEARTAIALFLRREAKYKEAIEEVRGLKSSVSPRLPLLPGRGQPAQGRRRGHGRRGRPTGRFIDGQRQARLFRLRRNWNWPTLAWATRLRGQRHFGEAAQWPTSKAAWTQERWSRNSRSARSLAAGECHDDWNGERQLAVRDYQAAIDCRSQIPPAPTPLASACAIAYTGNRDGLADVAQYRKIGTYCTLAAVSSIRSGLPLEGSTMAFFCQHCGTGLPVGARFCSNCGVVVTAGAYVPGRPLVRPIIGRQIAGVCIGLSQAYGWDLTLVRILTVLGIIFTSGLVAVAYLACWIGIPEEPVRLP